MGSNSVAPGLEIYDGRTGEVHGVITYPRDVEEQYIVRRLKMTVWQEAYLWVMEKTCKSAKDITLFRILTELADRQNLIMIGSATKFSKDNNISRMKLNEFTRRLVKIGFLGKESTNVYRMNPYVIISNKAYITSKTAKAILQVEWMKKYGYPPEPSELNEVETLITDNYDNHS